MARKSRTHISASDTPPKGAWRLDAAPPRHLSKDEFGRRLYQLLINKGWRQSDLARASGVLRDSVSSYVRGRSLPSPQNLHKIAEALGVKPEDLLPNYLEGAIEDDEPSFEMKVSPGDPSTSWVRLNQRLPSDVAAQIAMLVHSHAATRK